jgi:hypothetical protein
MPFYILICSVGWVSCCRDPFRVIDIFKIFYDGKCICTRCSRSTPRSPGGENCMKIQGNSRKFKKIQGNSRKFKKIQGNNSRTFKIKN